jgi:hypothetical protein
VDKHLELYILKSADELITVSQPVAEKLNKLHRRSNIHVITNGFDPETTKVSQVKLTNKFVAKTTPAKVATYSQVKKVSIFFTSFIIYLNISCIISI